LDTPRCIHPRPGGRHAPGRPARMSGAIAARTARSTTGLRLPRSPRTPVPPAIGAASDPSVAPRIGDRRRSTARDAGRAHNDGAHRPPCRQRRERIRQGYARLSARALAFVPASDSAARQAHPGVSARSDPASTDAGTPAILPGQAPRDRERQRLPGSTPSCPVPARLTCRALARRTGPRFGHMPCYAEALSLARKGLYLRKLVAGGGIEPATSGL
jgi:hypothetical protein